jgi:hypothetical protein
MLLIEFRPKKGQQAVASAKTARRRGGEIGEESETAGASEEACDLAS